jgi:16S rRNA (cytidine1402-2'-O)-methyltransferase
MPLGDHSDSRTQNPQDHEARTLSKALYVVATPLGNLDDITLRAIATLRGVDLIAAEDTRTSATLLRHHGIDTKTIAAHQHNEQAAAARIVALLHEGKSVALISDAGTPAVSDPGARIVRAVRDAGFTVVPVPGPNAVVAALSASGFEGPFHFAGFLPPKSAARSKLLAGLRGMAATLVLYEAPHRILDLAADLAAVYEPARRVVIARELTKRFETIHACNVGELGEWLAGDTNQQRGEFVVLIDAAPPSEGLDDEARRVLALLLAELPVKTAAALASRITGQSKNALYEAALAKKNEP